MSRGWSFFKTHQSRKTFRLVCATTSLCAITLLAVKVMAITFSSSLSLPTPLWTLNAAADYTVPANRFQFTTVSGNTVARLLEHTFSYTQNSPPGTAASTTAPAPNRVVTEGFNDTATNLTWTASPSPAHFELPSNQVPFERDPEPVSPPGTSNIRGLWHLNGSLADLTNGGTNFAANNGVWNGGGAGSCLSPCWGIGNLSDASGTMTQALRFDGTDDYVTAADPINFSNPNRYDLHPSSAVSVETWVYFNAVGATNQVLVWYPAQLAAGQNWSAAYALYKDTANRLRFPVPSVHFSRI